jgi:hypothetical protein
MAEIVGGLFGVTPESLQMQREKQAQQEALAYAQLSDPFARANYQIYQGASGLGRQLSGLLGAQDPEMMRIQQRQSMLQNLDLSSPESLKQGIQTAMQNKDYQLVSELTNRYQASAKAALEGRKTEAEIAAKLGEKLTPEQKNAAGLADAAGLQRGSQEWQAAYSKALKGLTDKNEPTSVVETSDGVFLVNKLTGEKISRVGGAPQRGTKVDVQVKQDEAVTKSNVEAFGKLRDSGIQAGQTIEAVKTIKPLIDQSFAGFASDSKLSAGQIAEAFGIPIKGTSETEQLRSLQNNLKIGNSTVLKGALSDKDMAILGEAIGQGSVTKAGLKSIMNNIEKDALISQRQYQKANEYQQQGKLSQYDFVKGSEESRAEVNTKLKRLAELERKARGQ